MYMGTYYSAKYIVLQGWGRGPGCLGHTLILVPLGKVGFAPMISPNLWAGARLMKRGASVNAVVMPYLTGQHPQLWANL